LLDIVLYCWVLSDSYLFLVLIMIRCLFLLLFVIDRWLLFVYYVLVVVSYFCFFIIFYIYRYCLLFDYN